MSTVQRILASRANGARSKGPVSAEGKRKSSKNAITHGLLARNIVLSDESPEGFEAIMNDHLERLQPADGMELGLIEDMAASRYRFHRALAIETRLIENESATLPDSDSLDRMSNAFDTLAAKPALGLIHRYQTRLYLNYQRALQNMLLLRALARPNEPRIDPTPVLCLRAPDDVVL